MACVALDSNTWLRLCHKLPRFTPSRDSRGSRTMKGYGS
jgi:hypothetical protein